LNNCDKTNEDAMRINERALASYSVSSATPVDRAGWLWKRGEVNRSFQRRWFVLRGNLLFYFEKRSGEGQKGGGGGDPSGVIVLEGCTVELAEEEQEKPFAFKIAFHGEGKRTYVAATESQEDLEEWMKILACASFDYMKLMVVELQHQLAELEEAEERAAAAHAAEATEATEATADGAGGGGEPRPPPRQRANPFNNQKQAKALAKRQTWASLHNDFGAKIRRDRAAWQSSRVT